MATVAPGRDYSWLNALINQQEVFTRERSNQINAGIAAFSSARAALDPQGMARARDMIEGKGWIARAMGRSNRPPELVNPDYSPEQGRQVATAAAMKEMDKQGWISNEAGANLAQEFAGKQLEREGRPITPFSQSQYKADSLSGEAASSVAFDEYLKRNPEKRKLWAGDITADVQKSGAIRADYANAMKVRDEFAKRQLWGPEAAERAALNQLAKTDIPGEISKESIARDKAAGQRYEALASLPEETIREASRKSGKTYGGSGSQQFQDIYERYRKTGDQDQFVKSATEWAHVYGVEPTALMKYITSPRGGGGGGGKEKFFTVFDANGKALGQATARNPEEAKKIFFARPDNKRFFPEGSSYEDFMATEASPEQVPKEDKDTIKMRQAAWTDKIKMYADEWMTNVEEARERVAKEIRDSGEPYQVIGDTVVYTGDKTGRLQRGGGVVVRTEPSKGEGGRTPGRNNRRPRPGSNDQTRIEQGERDLGRIAVNQAGFRAKGGVREEEPKRIVDTYGTRPKGGSALFGGSIQMVPWKPDFKKRG